MGGAPHPRMHGLTHVPGGPDPIPGLTITPPASSFPAAVAALAATRDLRGYWRLGDGASPFADTSGHPGGPADAVKIASGTAMTDSITGALPAADDDGAVQFNSFVLGDYLYADEPITGRFDFTSSPLTVAAWVKPTAGSTSSPPTIVGAYLNTIPYTGGWRLGLIYPALTPFFYRSQSSSTTHGEIIGPAITADTWCFLVGVYDTTDGHSIYIDGALAGNDPAVFGGIPALGGVWFSYGAAAGSTLNSYLGGLDEVSVWGDALTAAEIATLYEAGVSGSAAGAGVTSVAKTGDTPLTGDVTLSAGSNVTLTQVGQDIEVAAAGGSGIAATLLDAKGDLIAASAADTVAKLTVGSNGQVLTADSGETTGIKWATPSGGGGAWTLLSTTTLGSPGTFDVTGISGSYNDLVVVLIGRGTTAAGTENPQLKLNNDGGTNYFTQMLRAVQTTVTGAELLTQQRLDQWTIPAASSPANNFGVIEITFYGYASTAWKKTWTATVTAPYAGGGTSRIEQLGGLWASTAAINRVTIITTAGTFATGSQLRIYGRL